MLIVKKYYHKKYKLFSGLSINTIFALRNEESIKNIENNIYIKIVPFECGKKYNSIKLMDGSMHYIENSIETDIVSSGNGDVHVENKYLFSDIKLKNKIKSTNNWNNLKIGDVFQYKITSGCDELLDIRYFNIKTDNEKYYSYLGEKFYYYNDSDIFEPYSHDDWCVYSVLDVEKIYEVYQIIIKYNFNRNI